MFLPENNSEHFAGLLSSTQTQRPWKLASFTSRLSVAPACWLMPRVGWTEDLLDKLVHFRWCLTALLQTQISGSLGSCGRGHHGVTICWCTAYNSLQNTLAAANVSPDFSMTTPWEAARRLMALFCSMWVLIRATQCGLWDVYLLWPMMRMDSWGAPRPRAKGLCRQWHFFFFLAQRRKSPNSQGKARFWFFVQRWKNRKDLCLNEGTKGHVLEAELTLDVFIEQPSIILQLSNSN